MSFGDFERQFAIFFHQKLLPGVLSRAKRTLVMMDEKVAWWILTGPESTGKSTLASSLAEELGCHLVEEQVRLLMEDGHFLEIGATQVLALAELQYAAELLAEVRSDFPLVLDTDLLSYIVWYEWTYGPSPSHWRERLLRRQKVHYLLCRPDIPWVSDPLRQHPHVRQELFMAHEKLLMDMGLPFDVIEGHGGQRMQAVLEIVAQHSGRA